MTSTEHREYPPANIQLKGAVPAGDFAKCLILSPSSATSARVVCISIF